MPADPDFYKIGYARSMRAYGVEFKEGPDGFGVYASKDVEPLRRARVSCFTLKSVIDALVSVGVTFLVFHWKSTLLNCAGNYGNSTRIDVNHKPKAPMDVFPRYNPSGSSYI